MIFKVIKIVLSWGFVMCYLIQILFNSCFYEIFNYLQVNKIFIFSIKIGVNVIGPALYFRLVDTF